MLKLMFHDGKTKVMDFFDVYILQDHGLMEDATFYHDLIGGGGKPVNDFEFFHGELESIQVSLPIRHYFIAFTSNPELIESIGEGSFCISDGCVKMGMFSKEEYDIVRDKIKTGILKALCRFNMTDKVTEFDVFTESNFNTPLEFHVGKLIHVNPSGTVFSSVTSEGVHYLHAGRRYTIHHVK